MNVSGVLDYPIVYVDSKECWMKRGRSASSESGITEPDVMTGLHVHARTSRSASKEHGTMMLANEAVESKTPTHRNQQCTSVSRAVLGCDGAQSLQFESARRRSSQYRTPRSSSGKQVRSWFDDPRSRVRSRCVLRAER